MSTDRIAESLGYFLLSLSDVLLYCDSEERRTGHPHVWELKPGSNDIVEIKIMLPVGYFENMTPKVADEFFTVYFDNGIRMPVKATSAEEAVASITTVTEEDPNPYELSRVSHVVAGLDNCYTWKQKDLLWINESTLPKTVRRE